MRSLISAGLALGLILNVRPLSAASSKIISVDLPLRKSFFTGTADKSSRFRNDSVQFGAVQWLDKTHAAVEFQIWWLKGLAKIETLADQNTIRSLGVFPRVTRQGQDPWDFWRQKHGYKISAGKSYVWASLIEEHVPLDQNAGQFYDSYLKRVWSFWLLKKLPEKINSPSANKDEIVAEENLGWETKHIDLSVDSKGQIEPTPLLFKIHLWAMDVQIFFVLQSSSDPDQPNRLVLQNKIQWKYDMNEWRQQYGYRKTLWGSYAWDSDFPEAETYDKEHGNLLDRLLEKTVAFWVEVAVQDVLERLNREFPPLNTP